MLVIRPPRFDRRAKRVGLNEDDLTEITRLLVERPNAGAVIPGTGGARKVRVVLPGRGKRGGARLIYAIVLRSTALALLDVYAKSEQSDLTAHERKLIAAHIREIEAEFEK
jgi:hypothetical protein